MKIWRPDPTLAATCLALGAALAASPAVARPEPDEREVYADWPELSADEPQILPLP